MNEKYLEKLKVIDRIPIGSGLISFKAENAFILKCDGDGMSPRLPNKSLCVCEETVGFNSGDLIAIAEKVRNKNGTEKDGVGIWKATKDKNRKEMVILEKTNNGHFDKTHCVYKDELNVLGVIRIVMITQFY